MEANKSNNILQKEGQNEENVSNTSGWLASRGPMCPTPNLEVPYSTSQTVALLIYKISENPFNGFRSTLVKNTGVMKAYGHGEYLGMAKESTIRELSGCWGKNKGFGICSFDRMIDAEKFAAADSEIRDWLWLGGVEYYIVQCSSAMMAPSCMPYTCVELYDVKHGANFASAIQSLSSIVVKHGGHLSTASSNIKYVKGVKSPGFICISQWKLLSSAISYNNEVDTLFRTLNAGTGTRIVAEFDAFEI